MLLDVIEFDDLPLNFHIESIQDMVDNPSDYGLDAVDVDSIAASIVKIMKHQYISLTDST